MTDDRQALASDLEQLGLKAISGAVRRGTLQPDRVKKSVERLADRLRSQKRDVTAVEAVLERWWGEGE